MIAPRFTLRPYQADFIKKLSLSVMKNKRVIACAPTGSGKTKIFIQIAFNAIQKGRPVILISEAMKIYLQIIAQAGGTAIAQGVKHVEIKPGQLYVAMAQTLIRRPAIIESLNRVQPRPLIIIDEAHMGITAAIIGKLNPEEHLIIGFTATPHAGTAKHLPLIYNDCVTGPQVDQLIQEGFLCSYKHHARDKAELDILQIRNGEFTEKSQFKAFNRQQVYDGLTRDLKIFKFKKCMIFVSSIKHCQQLYQQLSDQGYRVILYHSRLQDSANRLAKFTLLNLAEICVSVSSLTKGFDFPDIDLVILLRATTSLPLYLQMIGRGSRITPQKSFFQVIDYGQNWKRHGLYWDNRDWQQLWRLKKTKKAKQAAAPVTACCNCMAVIPLNLHTCNYCGERQPLKEKQLQNGKLIEITAAYNSLTGKYIDQLLAEELAVYAKIKSKPLFAARIARAKEQSQPGFLRRFAKAMGYKKKWVDIQKQQTGALPVDFANIKLK